MNTVMKRKLEWPGHTVMTQARKATCRLCLLTCRVWLDPRGGRDRVHRGSGHDDDEPWHRILFPNDARHACMIRLWMRIDIVYM